MSEKKTSLKDVYDAITIYVEGQTGIKHTLPFGNEKCHDIRGNRLTISFEKYDVSTNEITHPLGMVINGVRLYFTVNIDAENTPTPMLENPIGYMEEICLPENDKGKVLVDVGFRWYHPSGGENGKTVYFTFKDGHISNIRA